METTRTRTLDLAVLGLLSAAPAHGYELRKRLGLVLGPLRVLSYGTLYPRLRALLERGLIEQAGAVGPEQASALSGRRARIVYRVTPAGLTHLARLLDESGSDATEDETFGVHFALFGRTDAWVRLRVLEGRRARVQERVDAVRATASLTRGSVDPYVLELQRHRLALLEAEASWLSSLIDSERGRISGTEPDRPDAVLDGDPASPAGTAPAPPP